MHLFVVMQMLVSFLTFLAVLNLTMIVRQNPRWIALGSKMPQEEIQDLLIHNAALTHGYKVLEKRISTLEGGEHMDRKHALDKLDKPFGPARTLSKGGGKPNLPPCVPVRQHCYLATHTSPVPAALSIGNTTRESTTLGAARGPRQLGSIDAHRLVWEQQAPA